MESKDSTPDSDKKNSPHRKFGLPCHDRDSDWVWIMESPYKASQDWMRGASSPAMELVYHKERICSSGLKSFTPILCYQDAGYFPRSGTGKPAIAIIFNAFVVGLAPGRIL